MKPNRCMLMFYCSTQQDCVYFVGNGEKNGWCKYWEIGICSSKVAQVNRLTLELEKLKEEK